MRLLRTPSLAFASYAFAIFAAVVLVGFTLLVVFRFGGTVKDQAAERAVVARTQSAAQDLGRELASAWHRLNWLGSQGASADPERLRGMLDFAVADGRMVRWAGFAGPDGIVQSASNRLLEGEDVSQRPWFQSGRQAPFAGDVHKAVLLASKLDGGDGLRFLDLAVPARGPQGAEGVFAFHIDMAWLTHTLDALARVRQVDLILVAQDGSVVYSTAPSAAQESSAILRAAADGIAASGIERWSGGGRYASSSVVRIVPEDMPNFGWRMIGRADPEIFNPDYADIYRHIGEQVLLACLMLLMGAVVFVRLAIRPIERLTSSAYRIASGDSEYPPEETGTLQARRLSAALAKLQS